MEKNKLIKRRKIASKFEKKLRNAMKYIPNCSYCPLLPKCEKLRKKVGEDIEFDVGICEMITQELS